MISLSELREMRQDDHIRPRLRASLTTHQPRWRFASGTTCVAALLIVIVLFALTACGSSPTKSPAPRRTAVQLADVIGCKSWLPSNPPGLYTTTEGGCIMSDGRNVAIATFDNADGEKAWVQAEKSLGGYIVQGNLWAANADVQADAKTVQLKLK
jgi:hypothetical protein